MKRRESKFRIWSNGTDLCRERDLIESAQEFVELRASSRPEDYLRAAHESAAPEVWTETIRMFPEMKVWVAHNKTVPILILSLLACDPDPNVRSAVAMKNKIPLDLMTLLANDTDESVRHRIVWNKNVPQEILEQLTRDQSELVSSAARHRQLRNQETV